MEIKLSVGILYDMNKNELIRKLNSVGKKSFVENYERFKRFASGAVSRDSAIEELVKLGVSNEAGAKIRLRNASQIFKAAQQHLALTIITESSRLPKAVLVQANVLLRSE
jgi:hypothetical protein